MQSVYFSTDFQNQIMLFKKQRVENTPLSHQGPQIPLLIQKLSLETKNLQLWGIFCLFVLVNHQRKKQFDPSYWKQVWAINLKSIGSKHWGEVQGTLEVLYPSCS